MPQEPPTEGASPDEKPTQPLPETPAESEAGADAPTVAYDPIADAQTAAYTPVPAPTEPIAPYVPIADASADYPARTAPPPPPPRRKSPVPWLLGAAVLILAAGIALVLWRPWIGGEPAPVTSPSQTVTPSAPPTGEPTEAPTSAPEPTQEPVPLPEPTQLPEPDPAPTEITPSPNPTVSPTVPPKQ